ncbi:integrator complex subunit 2 domain-containing protein [Ditylenchus destructor]|uniref:Integrator complex subunit 2 domain-containing protein n=1 Tax=Ditylenchus destructor TaxID=166010 RepID=A0AAD4N5J9_9BILA|nr:integrator complex subunit 2 domain-containing protein [Ditylenchus destructor]
MEDMSLRIRIFASLKDGTLVQELHMLDSEQVKLVIPVLMLTSFPTTSNFSEELDSIRSLLIDLHSGNRFRAFMDLDFAEIEKTCMEIWRNPVASPKKARSSFVQMDPQAKVLYICYHLIPRLNANDSAARMENLTFEPFDIEHCHEEVTWIMTLLGFFIPHLFDLSKIVPLMLNYSFGPQLITKFLFNQPSLWDTIVQELLAMRLNDDNAGIGKQREKALIEVLHLQPEDAELFVVDLLSSRAQLGLGLTLLCSEIVSDSFFVDVIISRMIKKEDPLAIYVTKTDRGCLKKICGRVGAVISKIKYIEIKIVYDQENEFSRSQDSLNERVILLLALLCSYPTLRLNTDECHEWILYLTSQTEAQCNLLKLALAAILACPNIMTGTTSTTNQLAFRDEIAEEYLKLFFQWLRQLASSSNPDYATLSQLMLLVAIHMNSNAGHELSLLLSSVLGFKVRDDILRKMSTVKTLFLSECVTDRDIAEKAAQLGVTKDLNANTSGYLPVHCINHLLASRTFAKYNVPIQDWIKSQMRECALPIHPVMVALLESFSTSCIPAEGSDNFNKAINEDFFMEVFSLDLFGDSNLVMQVLSLFYLLHYTYKLDTTPLTRLTTLGKQQPTPYSQQLWARIPIRYLLLVVDVRHDEFQHIRPLLHRFIAAAMPHMMPTLKSLLHNIDLRITADKDNSEIISQSSFEEALREIHNDGGSAILSHLIKLSASSIKEQYLHYNTIVKAMYDTLEPSTPKLVTEKAASIWHQFENVLPRRLYQDTLQLWLNSPLSACTGNVIVDDCFLIAETPYIFFRVDERVFKSPSHFECLMHMLAFYLDSSKNSNHIRLSRAKAQKLAKLEIEEKNQLLKSFIGTQYLAVVQLLLELCDESSEIVKIACGQIHQMFIADSQLPKLVHFNTYPLRLIPIMVKGVPSAWTVITFIGELLTHSNLERRIFGIILMAELVEQYKIPAAFAGIGLISDILDTLLCCTVNESYIVLFLRIVPALTRLIKVSPFHSAALIETLRRVREIATTRLSLYASAVTARSSPERKLVNLIDETLQNSDEINCC